MDYPTGFPTNEVSYRRFEDDAFPLTEADIPLAPENRKKTDRAFAFVLQGCVVTAICFLIFTFIYITKIAANGLGDTYVGEVTTRSWESLYKPNVVQEFDFHSIAWKLTLTSSISLGLTIIMAALYRHATSFIVWVILILSWMYFFLLTVALWLWNIDNIVLKIFSTFITVMLLIILIFMKDQIRLVSMLFKEAAKATFDMQAIFSVPIVTIVLLLVVVAIYTPATYYLSTAGQSTDLSDFKVVAIIFNTITTIWVCEFIIGIQYMIVSGAVTKWYFTRNKELLGDPIYTSVYVTIKYHLGTAALGSLIITLVAILRAIIRGLTQNSRLKLLVDCCMARIERLVRFFTKSAYIVTAMHGTSFIQSGKQAVKLLTLNICNTITINSLGDFVLTMSTIFIAAISVVVTYFILGDEANKHEYRYCFYIFAIVVSLICCFTILGTFETAFSTLFLCVCQDFLINDGNEKPYAMTRNLMEFLEDSKKLFAKKIEEKNLPKL